MTPQGNNPNRWPLADLRTQQQRTKEKTAVERQCLVLREANTKASPNAADAVVARIRRRQMDAPPEEATRFEVYRPAGGRPVLVAENQLVVRADDNQMSEIDTSETGFREARRTGPKTRVLTGKTHKKLEELLAEAKRLRKKGITANVNPIVPLGYVVKGEDYPGLATNLPPFSGTGDNNNVRVAIIDTGRTAEDRSDRWFTGVRPDEAEDIDRLDVLEPKKRLDWYAGHGTFTAGIVRQLSETCQIVVYRFTTTDGLGTDSAAAAAMLEAVDDAAAAGSRLIINASFGVPAVDGTPPVALQEAVELISQRPDVLIVASAGNDASTEKLYPAAFPQDRVRAVGALNPDLSEADFSNRGDWVDCSTVGVGIVSTFVEGKLPPEEGLGQDVTFGADAWATWSGTSFTAPQVSGAVAALCAENPTLNPQAAFALLIEQEGQTPLPGFGAVLHLLEGTPIT